MNKSQKIILTPESFAKDKHIKVNLEQDVDSFEILSLKVDTKKAYQNFNADYGVLIGRVNANDNLGIPNAKVSVFIPLDGDDEENSEVVSVYPYKTPTGEDKNGKRYNLLPRVGKEDPQTNIVRPKQPFGSFPIKEEVVTNPTLLEVYGKYYKYSTVTNESGDYIIFGVPTGIQIVHMSVDITDIGQYSMSPASMITNLGYSPNLFKEDGTMIKETTNLNDLPNIETTDISVDIIPFWGDANNFEIGITRQDFKIRAYVERNLIVFGTTFTDGEKKFWGSRIDVGDTNARELYSAYEEVYEIANGRFGKVTEQIFYYPNEFTYDDLNSNAYTSEDAILLSSSEYTSYKSNGDFVFILTPNRTKVITAQDGTETVVDNDYPGGVFTEFAGFMTFEYTPDDVTLNDGKYAKFGKKVYLHGMRGRLKVPQRCALGETFDETDDSANSVNWKRAWKKFNSKYIYSVTQMHNHVFNNQKSEDHFRSGQFLDTDKMFKTDRVNLRETDIIRAVGTVQTNASYNDIELQFPTNWSFQGDRDGEVFEEKMFSGNWLNFALHFKQMGRGVGWTGRIEDMKTNTSWSAAPKSDHSNKSNNSLFAGGVFNTAYYMRSDIHQTDFIATDRTTLINFMNDVGGDKGFKLSDTQYDNADLPEGTSFKNGKDALYYQNGTVVNGSGKVNLLETNPTDTEYYFFRGLKDSDCLSFMRYLGLL